MKLSSEQHEQLLFAGAQVMHARLKDEISTLERVFPSLNGGSKTVKAKREAIREHLETRQKKHWTQTPEGRKKMGRIQRKAWRKRRNAEAQV